MKGVFHCFSGSYEMAKELIRRGWYIGFTGVVTFKNARKAVEVAEKIPLDRILIETDCPYMAPEPFRGRRNDPSLVPFVAKKIAEIRGISAEEAAADRRRRNSGGCTDCLTYICIYGTLLSAENLSSAEIRN